MKVDVFRICGNCDRYRHEDRYHGHCAIKSEIRTIAGVEDITNMRVRWNRDARNCEDFRGAMR